MPLASYSTSGYGTSAPRTSARTAGRAAPYDPNNAPGNPARDNLSGRNKLADTRAGEIGNDRSLAEIEALKRRLALDEGGQQFTQSHTNRTFALDEEMRRKQVADGDTIRALLMKNFGGVGESGAPAVVAMPSSAPPAPPAPPAPAAPVADQAFARAKDRAGQSMQSGLRTLRSVMQRKGQAGSSIEGDAVAGLIGGETQRLADVDLASAVEGQRRGYELDDRAHDDTWREREIVDRNRTNGLEMLLRLMTQGRAY